MHFYSFDMQDPIFDLGSWRVSVQIITLENIYGLDPQHCHLDRQPGQWTLQCDRLSWAGQQERAQGTLTLVAQERDNQGLRVKIRATAPAKIRCVKLLVRDLPPLKVLDLVHQEHDVPEEGLLLRYPSPGSLRLPVLVARSLDADGRAIGFRCEDPQIRAKRFALFSERELHGPEGRTLVELIHEEDAQHFDTQVDVPTWIVEPVDEVDAFVEAQLDFAEQNLGLVPWERRTDMPRWMHDVALCVTLHGMHWSGHAFLTYDQMLGILRFVGERIEPHRVLAYIAGWEGRYYWQYGDYRPDPRLGGAEGFARLCTEARNMGIHVMPMVGGNCVNAWFPNFHAFGPDAYLKSATRNRFHGNCPDWDEARSHDTGWQAWLNPGHPAWQNELCRQILNLVDEYGFDAVYLDTLHVWTNDPDHNVFEGKRELAALLRAGRPDFLVMAENWYDGMLGVFPLFLVGWKYEWPTPEWFGRYARTIAFLGEVEPSQGSGGVQHQRHFPYRQPTLRQRHLPTVAFIEGTLENAQAEVERAIDLGKEYARRFLD